VTQSGKFFENRGFIQNRTKLPLWGHSKSCFGGHLSLECITLGCDVLYSDKRSYTLGASPTVHRRCHTCSKWMSLYNWNKTNCWHNWWRHSCVMVALVHAPLPSFYNLSVLQYGTFKSMSGWITYTKHSLFHKITHIKFICVFWNRFFKLMSGWTTVREDAGG
jgi:hypothetical protein